MNWNRVLSGLVALSYIVIATISVGAEGAFKVGIFVIFPLFCIWFSEAMGGYTGPGMMWFDYPITQKSPGIFICILGWIILLLPVMIVIIGHFSS